MMINNLTELAKLIDLCRKKGIETLKMSGIEISLSSSAPQIQNKRKKKHLGEVKDTEFTPQYSDEEILMWSSPSYLPNMDV